MMRYHAAAARTAGRPAFTLVEMLMVMAILAILAGMVLGALNAAQHSVNLTRTRSLVARIGQAVMSKWDGYRTRRVPINPTMSNSTAGNNAVQRARSRLLAMWELQRMEFPQEWVDVTSNPTQFNIAQRPAASRGYLARLGTTTPSTAQNNNQNAECLFMICSMGLGTDGLAAVELAKSQVRDVDGDGLREFVDAWGNPIDFIRWPAGFVSDVMPLASATTAPYRDPWNDPDPVDFARMAVPDVGSTPDPPHGHRVVPLVFSSGPDGVAGIFARQAQQALTVNSASGPFAIPAALNPWSAVTVGGSPAAYPAPWEKKQLGGRYTGLNGAQHDQSLDNIHSHQSGMK